MSNVQTVKVQRSFGQTVMGCVTLIGLLVLAVIFVGAAL